MNDIDDSEKQPSDSEGSEIQHEKNKLFEEFNTIVEGSKSSKTWALSKIVTLFSLLFVYKLIALFENESRQNLIVMETIYNIFEFCNFRTIKSSQAFLYYFFYYCSVASTSFYLIFYAILLTGISTSVTRLEYAVASFRHMATNFLWFYQVPTLSVSILSYH